METSKNKVSSQLQKGKSVFERLIFCPGCKCGHGFRTKDWPMPPNLSSEDIKFFKNKWTWNGSITNPTLSPSLNVKRKIGVDSKGKPIYETICHSFIKNGQIQFLNDCKHDLKGQTVELPEF